MYPKSHIACPAGHYGRFRMDTASNQHNEAVSNPTMQEAALLKFIIGWLELADCYRSRWNIPIGEDGYLGPFWKDTGMNVLAFLNGETGRLDCTAMAQMVRSEAERNACKLPS